MARPVQLEPCLQGQDYLKSVAKYCLANVLIVDAQHHSTSTTREIHLAETQATLSHKNEPKGIQRIEVCVGISLPEETPTKDISVKDILKIAEEPIPEPAVEQMIPEFVMPELVAVPHSTVTMMQLYAPLMVPVGMVAAWEAYC